MAQSLLAPFVLRPRRLAALLIPAVLVAAAVGCGHRRSSMRPVYTTPVPSRPCPSGDCGSGAGLAVPPAASPTTIEPSTVSPGAPATMPGASMPPGSPPVAPTITGPSPGFSDEPTDLQPAGTGESSRVPAPKAPGGAGGSGAAPGALKGSSNPGASLKDESGRRTATGRVRQASLGERVKPFLDDPDDLFQPPKADRPWKYIVLHHSASATGGYDTIDREHRERLGWQGCGYHFVIGNGTESPDGRIEVARRWADQKLGVHCRDGKNPDVNEYGIGICLVGDLEKAPPTDRQIAAARALVAYLGGRYRISPDHTETHAHLAASPTSCPGRHFPTRAILGSSGLALR